MQVSSVTTEAYWRDRKQEEEVAFELEGIKLRKANLNVQGHEGKGGMTQCEWHDT